MGLPRKIGSVAEGQDRKILAVAMLADLAERNPLGRIGIVHQPTAVAGFVQIAYGIKRDRLKEHYQPLLFARQPHAFAQHHRGVGAIGWAGQYKPRYVTQDCDRIVVVEMAAEALLVA
jgi:hypothetical protein